MTVQAGLLTCGSMLVSAFPCNELPSGILEKNSPPTVAGAVADLARPHRIPISPILRSANLNTLIIRINLKPVNMTGRIANLERIQTHRHNQIAIGTAKTIALARGNSISNVCA